MATRYLRACIVCHSTFHAERSNQIYCTNKGFDSVSCWHKLLAVEKRDSSTIALLAAKTAQDNHCAVCKCVFADVGIRKASIVFMHPILAVGGGDNQARAMCRSCRVGYYSKLSEFIADAKD